MDITLTKEHILSAVKFNLRMRLRVEQHLIGHLDRSHVGTDGYNPGP